MGMKVKIEMDTAAILRARGLGDSHEAQLKLASEVERLSKDYVPKSSGSGAHLKDSAQIASDGSSITYPGPYAHYLYVGATMGGRKAPRHYTGGSLSYNGAPMRGKEWVKRMVADHAAELAQSVADITGGKAK